MAFGCKKQLWKGNALRLRIKLHYMSPKCDAESGGICSATHKGCLNGPGSALGDAVYMQVWGKSKNPA